MLPEAIWYPVPKWSNGFSIPLANDQRESATSSLMCHLQQLSCSILENLPEGRHTLWLVKKKIARELPILSEIVQQIFRRKAHYIGNIRKFKSQEVCALASLPPPTPHSTFSVSVPCVRRGQNMPTTPILHLNYVMDQSSIRYWSYTLDPHHWSKPWRSA